MPTYLISDDVRSQLEEDLSDALQAQQTGFLTAETMRDLNFNVLGKLKETLKWARYGAAPSENPDDWFM